MCRNFKKNPLVTVDGYRNKKLFGRGLSKVDISEYLKSPKRLINISLQSTISPVAVNGCNIRGREQCTSAYTRSKNPWPNNVKVSRSLACVSRMHCGLLSPLRDEG